MDDHGYDSGDLNGDSRFSTLLWWISQIKKYVILNSFTLKQKQLLGFITGVSVPFLEYQKKQFMST
jgi:hypothetical protein